MKKIQWVIKTPIAIYGPFSSAGIAANWALATFESFYHDWCIIRLVSHD